MTIDECTHDHAKYIGFQPGVPKREIPGFDIADCVYCGSTISIDKGFREIRNMWHYHDGYKMPLYAREEIGRGRNG